ncbi:J domain-containing protein [Chryseolinea soli]|uniref:J domain-containing protein n=1 Tax=Chryseolinea soli TaxID=2321403 RepID=UPI0013572BD3|nr:J domain-containing protein [Chryseolinea soli]
MTYYEILGISGAASIEEIKTAYSRLISTHPNEVNHAVVQLKEAYGVLSDPVRKQQYDHSLYGPPPQPVVEYEEDPRGVYRREYIQRKQREKQEEERRLDRQRQNIFRIMRRVNFVILAYAVLLTIDYCLPARVYQEVGVDGWQKTFGRRRGKGNLVYSFMETTHFTLTVSYELLQRYDFDAKEKEPLVVKATQICRIPTTVSLAGKESTQTYRVLSSPFSDGIARPLILLIVTTMILLFRKYSYVNYMNCFMPVLLFFLMVPPWFHF